MDFDFSAINFDLLSVGLAVTISVTLGFIVFFRDRQSRTAIWFLSFILVSAALGIVNYLSYQPTDPGVRLWLIRSVMFFSVLQSLSFFTLVLIFPEKEFLLPGWWRYFVLPISAGGALFTLTPFVFSGLEVVPSGRISQPIAENGILVFAGVTLSLVIGGIILLLRKKKRALPEMKIQLQYLFAGTALMFALLIGFNFVFPALLKNTRFVPLNALFMFPFAAFTFYAIVQHRFLAVRLALAEILTLIVVGVTFFEILFADSAAEIIFRSALLGLLLTFGILLIRSVRREVEQREQMEVMALRLAEANERLEELDNLKSEFISMAGHQLRVPLTVIKGYVSLILEGTIAGASEKVKEVLQKVAFSNEQLVKLVASLLDLSRIEAGKIKYDFAKGDLAAVVSEVMDKFRTGAEKKGLVLAFENKVGVAETLFDRDKIREAAVNYIDNAVKYSDQGRITVKLERVGEGDEARLRLSVQDSGLGVKAEDVEKLFGKFSRTAEAQAKDPNGMGIGLYFVKRVVEDHGGVVGASSEGIGKGSTFWLELPIKNSRKDPLF